MKFTAPPNTPMQYKIMKKIDVISTFMIIQVQKSNYIDQYTYLGYNMNIMWGVFGKINNKKHKISKAE
ncbi:hypothetical protein AYI69_g3170 [Smittium culicis]|uniref:PiggyBac transposable element-derived protein domain-containing protein n=1 Tax=Smittium culicis TaxID=133412 RepID=A0A1R1YKG4_9FUNG|nr:hypothetical protein AYI69_g3170 [Smittium culicis]